jgi:formate dehydrogenase maturation protein FdhE
MAEWLRFMAQLAQAQHATATTLPPVAGPSLAAVEQAAGARMPPLAADRISEIQRGATLLVSSSIRSKT